MAEAQPYTRGPTGGSPDSSCHTAGRDKDSRGQAVLLKGEGQGALELQHCQIGKISLHLINSPGIQLRQQKGCSLKVKTKL